MSARVLVAGIGNEYRHDDGAGPEVAARVVASLPDAGDIGPVGEPMDLLGRWDEAELVVVIDAVRSGAAPGTILVLDLRDGNDVENAAAQAATSSHGIGLLGTLRIARATSRAPQQVVLVAIEGADFTQGCGLSSPVEAALDGAVGKVLELLSASG